MPEDLYQILGVSPNSNPDEIKKAYRKIAREYHPDVNQDDPAAVERFKKATEAYEILSDPEKKYQYDNFGGSDIGFGGFDNIGDIFGMFFGDSFSTRRSPQQRPGSDLLVEAEVTLEEIFTGVKKEVEVTRQTTCDKCQATGSKEGTSPEVCPKCQGNGQVAYSQSTLLGNITRSYPCDMCNAEGKIITQPCQSCKGQGRVQVKEKVSIDIPPGVTDGIRLKIGGRGDAGFRGSPIGDLYIEIRTKTHEYFIRKNDDIIFSQPLSFTQAALGAEIKIPTLNGSHKLNIPPGTQGGTEFKLKNKGIPHLQHRGQGDQYVIIQVETPTKLTGKEKKLLVELAKLRGEDTSTLSQKTLKKIKDAISS